MIGVKMRQEQMLNVVGAYADSGQALRCRSTQSHGCRPPVKPIRPAPSGVEKTITITSVANDPAQPWMSEREENSVKSGEPKRSTVHGGQQVSTVSAVEILHLQTHSVKIQTA